MAKFRLTIHWEIIAQKVNYNHIELKIDRNILDITYGAAAAANTDLLDLRMVPDVLK